MKKRIAIIFHENENRLNPGYVISRFADIWREEGNEIIFLFGTKQYLRKICPIGTEDLHLLKDFL